MRLADLLVNPELLCGIPYAAIGEMVATLIESEKDKRERSIGFCISQDELQFPKLVGGEEEVPPAPCPEGLQEVGTFHTHREELEKTLEDWAFDFRRAVPLSQEPKTRVSCTAWPVDLDNIWWHMIDCHAFNVGQAGYEGWHKEVWEYAVRASHFSDALSDKLLEEERGPTERELKAYKKVWTEGEEIVAKGEKQGFIVHCPSYFRPNIKRTLQRNEQA
jgi:hypothetical protein